MKNKKEADLEVVKAPADFKLVECQVTELAHIRRKLRNNK